MVRIRRAGLVVGCSVFVATIIAAFVAEGIGLAVIVVIGALVVAGMVIPFLAIFEEERGLPSARSNRSRLPQR